VTKGQCRERRDQQAEKAKGWKTEIFQTKLLKIVTQKKYDKPTEGRKQILLKKW
jgi:hypothetical protein